MSSPLPGVLDVAKARAPLRILTLQTRRTRFPTMLPIISLPFTRGIGLERSIAPALAAHWSADSRVVRVDGPESREAFGERHFPAQARRASPGTHSRNPKSEGTRAKGGKAAPACHILAMSFAVNSQALLTQPPRAARAAQRRAISASAQPRHLSSARSIAFGAPLSVSRVSASAGRQGVVAVSAAAGARAPRWLHMVLRRRTIGRADTLRAPASPADARGDEAQVHRELEVSCAGPVQHRPPRAARVPALCPLQHQLRVQPGVFLAHFAVRLFRTRGPRRSP